MYYVCIKSRPQGWKAGFPGNLHGNADTHTGRGQV